MLMYSPPALSADSYDKLFEQQSKVDSEPDRKSKYGKATALFKSKSPKSAFDEVKNNLKIVSPPGETCFYCEQDRHRDIDHFYPKRHYPERAFQWENYIFACTICNQDEKNDRFAVFDKAGNIIAFDRSLSMDQPVPEGDAVLLNIRAENPQDFIRVELETGRFINCGAGARADKRGTFTRELFDLDSDVLCSRRRHAANAFRNYLQIYNKRVNSQDVIGAARMLDEIKELPFPSVYYEMRRQAASDDDLKILFAFVPANFYVD